jgi:hypothetical protein
LLPITFDICELAAAELSFSFQTIIKDII